MAPVAASRSAPRTWPGSLAPADGLHRGAREPNRNGSSRCEGWAERGMKFNQGPEWSMRYGILWGRGILEGYPNTVRNVLHNQKGRDVYSLGTVLLY